MSDAEALGCENPNTEQMSILEGTLSSVGDKNWAGTKL